MRIARDSLPSADIRVLRHQACTDIPELADGCFSSLGEACAFLPQATIIANPAPFHLNTALALAEVGSHLLIEKPLSHNVDNVKSFLQQVSELNLVLQVGYNLRYLSSLEQFRERIQSGTIGRVMSVRCEIGQYLPSWRPDTDYRQGVSARHELGGGVLLELSHELDYLRWIFGEVVWVNAWLGRQSALEIDVEDTAHLTLGFTPDAAGHAPVAAISLDFIRHDAIRMCTAIGEQGSLRWNGITGTVEVWPVGSTAWQPVFQYAHQRDESYRVQWEHFMACINNGQVPIVSGEDGLAVLEIIAATRQSDTTQGARIMMSSSIALAEA